MQLDHDMFSQQQMSRLEKDGEMTTAIGNRNQVI